MFRLTLKHRGKGEILVARSINKVGSSIGVINTRASASAQVGSSSQGKHRQACPQALEVAVTTHAGQPGMDGLLLCSGVTRKPRSGVCFTRPTGSNISLHLERTR